tara:strand:+ start:5006 stop:5968 length:963 start_codon:yes stop_codon:yes gene_type:complete
VILSSAPGKLFLSGEYAVMEGAPALVMPVSQRAIVSREEGDDWRTRADRDLALPYHEIPLVKSVCDELSRRNLSFTEPEGGLCLDTRAFFTKTEVYHEVTKLGLGGSAALTVALLKALFPKPANWSQYEYLVLAMACHQRFQGGLGSGADVTVAVLDDLVRFRIAEEPVTARLPSGLAFGFVWTGRGAGTVSYLDRMQQFKVSDPGQYKALMHPLIPIATDLSRPGIGEDAFRRGIAEMDSCLNALSERSTGFYTDIHVELRDLVTRSGGVYKPSGAGGGDFGMVVATDADHLKELNEMLAATGFRADLVSTDRFMQETE